MIENILLGWFSFALKDKKIKQRWETRMLCEEKKNRKQEKEADWMASPKIRLKIAPTFLCWPKTLWGFWNVSFISLYSPTLRQWTPFIFIYFFFLPLTVNIAHISVPWSLKAQHFSASNSHWDQSPEMEMQRICFIGQLQTNKSKYVFVCRLHPEGVGVIMWHK